MGGDREEAKSKQKEYQTSLLLLGSIVMVRSLCQLSFKLGLRLRRKVTKKIRKQQIVLPLDIVDWILLTYRVYNDYSSLRRKLIYLKDFQQRENSKKTIKVYLCCNMPRLVLNLAEVLAEVHHAKWCPGQ